MTILQSEVALNYKKVTIMPSLQCDANCRHCLFLPEIRQASRHDLKLIFGVIDGLPKGIIHVSITGGEPFFKESILFEIARRLSRNNHEFSIVTNGLWTRRTNSKIDIIRRLKELGLNGISVSFDDYHRPRLTEGELINFLTLTASLGIRIETKSCGSRMKTFVNRTRQRFKRKDIPIEVEFFSLEHVGSACDCRKDIVNKRICSSCRLVGTPLMLPGGSVFACCTLEVLEIENDWLIRGNAKKEPIGRILRRSERDFRLIALAAMGPAGLARVVGVKPKKDETSCELCVRILNNADYRKELEERLQKDKRLRQEVVGRFFALSYKLYQKEKQQREKWREYFRRIGVEK